MPIRKKMRLMPITVPQGTRPFQATPADMELDRAIRRVYETYGTDLPAFFRSVHRQLSAEHAGSTSERQNLSRKGSA